MDNKATVNDTYLLNVVAMDTDQSSLVTMAFEAIENGRRNNNTANCQIAIIIITDRPIANEMVTVVNEKNGKIQSLYQTNAKLFVTSLTNDRGYQDDVAVQLTCNHSGVWNKVFSIICSFVNDYIVCYCACPMCSECTCPTGLCQTV